MTRSEKIKILRTEKPFKVWDILLFGAAIVLIAVLITVSYTRPQGAYVSVRIAGEVTDFYSLNESGRYTIGEGNLVLVIEGGYAYVMDSRCPDHYCEKMGKIRLEGQQIICLPQEIVIEITSETDGRPGDLVTG